MYITELHFYKNILKTIVFISSIIIISIIFSKILTFKAPEYLMMNSFYNEDTNLIDVLCIGSSHAYTSCNTEEYWNKYGIPVYCLSSPGQPLGISYYYLKEALRYTKPRVLLLEFSVNSSAWDCWGDYCYGVALSSLKQNINRWMILLNGVPFNLKNSLISNTVFYHNRWKNLTKDDFIINSHNTHGFNPWWSYEKYKDNIIIYSTKQKTEPDTKIIQYVQKIINVCKDNNIIPVIYISPHIFDEGTYAKINWWRSYFEKEGIDFIDGIQLADELNIIPEIDNANGHISYYGAKKLSAYIGKRLTEKNYVSDHRGEEAYNKWALDANYYCKYEKQFDLENHSNDIKTYIPDIMNINDVAVIITYSGNNGTIYNSHNISSFFDNIDIPIDINSDNPFLGLYANGKVLYESQEKTNIFDGYIFEKKVKISAKNTINSENLIIDSNEFSNINYLSENQHKDNAIKIYVYSLDLKRIIDTRNFQIDSCLFSSEN